MAYKSKHKKSSSKKSSSSSKKSSRSTNKKVVLKHHPTVQRIKECIEALISLSTSSVSSAAKTTYNQTISTLSFLGTELAMFGSTWVVQLLWYGCSAAIFIFMFLRFGSNVADAFLNVCAWGGYTLWALGQTVLQYSIYSLPTHGGIISQQSALDFLKHNNSSPKYIERVINGMSPTVQQSVQHLLSTSTTSSLISLASGGFNMSNLFNVLQIKFIIGLFVAFFSSVGIILNYKELVRLLENLMKTNDDIQTEQSHSINKQGIVINNNTDIINLAQEELNKRNIGSVVEYKVHIPGPKPEVEYDD